MSIHLKPELLDQFDRDTLLLFRAACSLAGDFYGHRYKKKKDETDYGLAQIYEQAWHDLAAAMKRKEST